MSDQTELFDAAINGTATDADRARLAELLRTDDDARADFIRHMDLNAALYREAAESSVDASPVARPDETRGASHSGGPTPGVSRRTHIAYAIAATLLLTAAAVAIYVVVSGPVSPEPSVSAPVATLIESDGTVIYDNSVANPGDEYPPGTYTLDSGSAQLMLRSKVIVDLRGETRLRMHNPMSASLDSGSATFHCPPGAEGFTVHLPSGARIVDLGTRFRVHVSDDGSGTVYVGEGRVEIRGESGTVFGQLAAGQAVRFGPERQFDRMDDRAIAALGLRPPNSEMFEVFTNGLAGTARATAAHRGVDLIVHSTDTGGSFLAGHFVTREPVDDRDDAVRITWRLRGVESVNRFGLGVQNYRGFNWAPGSFSILLTAPGSVMSDQKPGTFRVVVGTDGGGRNLVEPAAYDTAALDGDLTVTLEIDPQRWTLTSPELAIDLSGSTRDSEELASLLEGPLYANCFVHARGQTPAILRVLDLHTRAPGTSTDHKPLPSAAETADPPRSVAPSGTSALGENLTPDSE